MQSADKNRLIGYLLIVLGLILIMNTFNLLDWDNDIWWGITFLVIGIAAILTYYRKSRKLVYFITGIISLLIGLSKLIHAVDILPDGLVGALVLWCISGLFLTVHFTKNEPWWPVLPGGLFFTLGFMKLLDAFHFVEGERLWFVFFLGVSLIFWYLFFIKDERNKLSWARYPAIVITVFSFFILSVTWENRLSDVLFPISLIALGAYMVIVNMLQEK